MESGKEKLEEGNLEGKGTVKSYKEADYKEQAEAVGEGPDQTKEGDENSKGFEYEEQGPEVDCS